ncbi:MAG TPA: M90 family metallopeptidase [Sulfuricurvum sp.]|nr:M90 family metallopeptidase [Sulfuricurvum sp.]
MNYSVALLIVVGGLGTLFFTLFLLNEWRKKRLLHTLEAFPFSEQYEVILAKMPHYQKLSAADRIQLQHSILHFIYTKEFLGIDLEVTDEIKVIIAFYACLLLVHKGARNCYDNLQTIVIYPHSIVNKQVKSYGGIYTKEQFMIAGQSSNDTVVVSWHEAKREAYHMRHNNVIIHEFAHEIDFMDGEIDGVPPIENSKYGGWVHMLTKEFNALHKISQKNRGWGKYKLLGAYAASNEAEFFAVVTERFFESPLSLKQHFPELYNEFMNFYQIDTVKVFG